MNDSDQSSAAATGPHRQYGDEQTSIKQSLWSKLRAALASRAPSVREDLVEALEEDEGNGKATFSDNERLILQNVLKLGDMRVEDVMVPRADIEAVEDKETMATLIALFNHAGHSRLPIYTENLDNIVGFVHIKDALQRLTTVSEKSEDGDKNSTVKFLTPVLKRKIGNKELIRELLFVPPSMLVSDLLQKMQATRVHMAMVVDEYGGTDGLVTIEDLLEAVVGDIEDEHDDEDENMVVKIDDNVFIADARVELTELRETVGVNFDTSEFAEDADTLGGLIFNLVDRVPVRGEVIAKFRGFEFEIMQADARRIKKVRITRRRRGARPRTEKPVPDDVQPKQ